MAEIKRERISWFDLHGIDRFRLALNLDGLANDVDIALRTRYGKGHLIKADEFEDKGDEEEPDRKLPAQGCFQIQKTFSVWKGWHKGTMVYLDWDKNKEYDLKLTVDAFSKYEKVLAAIFGTLLAITGLALGGWIGNGRALFGQGWIAMVVGLLAGLTIGTFTGMFIAALLGNATVSNEVLQKNEEFANEVKGVVIPIVEKKIGPEVQSIDAGNQ